jgi:hypothetical protein
LQLGSRLSCINICSFNVFENTFLLASYLTTLSKSFQIFGKSVRGIFWAKFVLANGMVREEREDKEERNKS